MDLKRIDLLFLLLSVAHGSNDPQLKTRVYNKDYSVSLRGVQVTKSSWTSSRPHPTLEKSRVACATTCVDKYRDDLSCNSIMYARETQECHLGNTTLANAGEAAEFVYRIPDGTGERTLLFVLGFQFLGTEYREYGVLYFGRNFKVIDWVPTVDECAQSCKDSELCKFWWWEKYGTNRCALKQAVSFKRDSTGHISGNKP